MPTTEELFEQMANTDPAEPTVAYVTLESNISRYMVIPPEYSIFGVEGDKKVERLLFSFPRYVGDNIDLSTLQLYVNFQNALGTDTPEAEDQYIVEDLAISGENVTFSWLLSQKVTAYIGTVQFIVCAVNEQNGVQENVWNTTIGTGTVLEGLPVNSPAPTPDQSDVITQLLNLVKTTSQEAVEAVQNAEQEALQKIQAIPVVNNNIISFGS